MSNGFDEYIAKAQQLAEEGDFDNAIDLYKSALSEDTTNEEIRREVINLTLKKGDFQQAIVEYFDWAEACQFASDIDDAIRIYQEILSLDSLLKKKTFMMDQHISEETITQIQETIQAASGAIFFNMGYLYLEKSSLDEAIDSVKKSLDFNPSDAKAHTLLGQVYMQKEQDKEAIGEFQEVVRLAPDEAAYAYEMLGEIYIRGGKTPQSTIVWFRNAGDLYLKHEQMEDAIRAYERIISFEAKNKEVLFKVGEIYAHLDSKERAIEIYNQLAEIFTEEGLLDKVIAILEKIVEWDPNNGEAREKIIQIYRRILEMDPSNLTARSKLIGNILRKGSAEEAIPEFLALSETYMEKGMGKEAYAVCKKLLDLDPKNARAHELIADIYFEQNAGEKALKEYLNVIKLYQDQDNKERADEVNAKLKERFPGTREVTQQMAASYMEQKQYDKALAEFQKLLASEPNNVNIYLKILDIFEIQNDSKNTILLIKKIMEVDPSRTNEMRNKLLRIYEERGDKEKLLEMYNRILAEDPNRNDIRQKVLEIVETSGDQDKVIVMYRQMLEADPDRVDLRQKMIEYFASESRIADVMRESGVLASVFMKQNDIEKAENLFKNILAFMPDDINTREQLTDLYEKKGESEKVQEELLVLANLSCREGKLESTIERYQKMLEFTPGDINIKSKVAKLAYSNGNTNEAVHQYRDIADIYMDKKMYDPAMEAIKSVLGIEEQNIEYRQKLIEILKNQLKVEEAVQNYKILLTHFLRMHQNDDAVVAARDAIAIRPMDLDFRREIVELFLEGNDIENGRTLSGELINLYMDRGDYSDIIQLYDRISEIYRGKGQMGDYYEYRENIAQIYERQARNMEAIDEYLSILESNLIESRIDETNRLFPLIINLYFKESRPGEAVDSFTRLVTKLHRFGKSDECILTLEQVLHVQERIEGWEQAHDTLNRIADHYRDLSQSDKVVETLRRKIDIFLKQKNIASAIDVMFDIIRFYLTSSDLEAALSQFEEVDRFEPGEAKLIFRMAQTLFEFGYFKEAKPLYEKVLEKESDNYDAMARVAIIYAKSGNLQDAVVYTRKIFSKGLVAEVIDAYKKSTDITQDPATMHVNLGLFYQEMGFIEEAILEFQTAAQDPKRLLEAYNLMAMCFKQEGFIDLAIRQFERALEQPGYPEEEYLSIRYNLGETLLENGQLQEALSAFYECYMVDINYRDIAEKIAMLNEQISAGEAG